MSNCKFPGLFQGQKRDFDIHGLFTFSRTRGSPVVTSCLNGLVQECGISIGDALEIPVLQYAMDIGHIYQSGCLNGSMQDCGIPTHCWCTGDTTALHNALYTVYSRYILVVGVQGMVLRYKWECDISGSCQKATSCSLFQRDMSDNGVLHQ